MSSIGEGIDFSQEQQKISGMLSVERGKGSYCSVGASLFTCLLVRTSSEWPSLELRPHWSAFPRWLWHQLVTKTWPLRALFYYIDSVGLDKCCHCGHTLESPEVGVSISFPPGSLSHALVLTQITPALLGLFTQAVRVRSASDYCSVKWTIMPGFFLRRDVLKVPLRAGAH